MLQSPALSGGGLPASPTRRPAAGRASDRLVYALVDVSRVDDPAEAAAVATWRRYEGPLRVTEPGKYAVLTKLIPGAPPMAQADADAKGRTQLRSSEDLSWQGSGELCIVLLDLLSCLKVPPSDACSGDTFSPSVDVSLFGYAIMAVFRLYK